MLGPMSGILSPLGRARTLGVSYLLQDRFTTNQAAPLGSPRTCEPGPGSWLVSDPGVLFSIASSKLNCGAGSASYRMLNGAASFARQAGRAIFGTVNKNDTTSNGMVHGWSRQNDFQIPGLRTDHVISFEAGALIWNYIGTGFAQLGTYAATTDYEVVNILRGTGGFQAIKGGAFTNWTLLWVQNAETTTPLYPYVQGHAPGTFDNCRITDLGSPWDTDYGIATSRLAGARTAGDQFTHAPDFLLEFRVPTLPNTAITIKARMQDANNYIWVRILSTGNVLIYKVVNGVSTNFTNAAGAVGERVMVVFEGPNVTVFINDVRKTTTSTASVFTTQTAGEINNLDGGGVSDLVTWPRDLSSLIPVGV